MSERADALLGLLKSGRDSAVLRFGLAQVLHDEGRSREAIEHLQSAVQQDPTYSAAWKLLGKAHLASDDPSGAQRAYEQGIEAAQANGDQQAAREMTVFLKRVRKQLGER